MPKLGEIKKHNKSSKGTFIWQACVDCGKERWVSSIGGQAQSLRCRSCSKTGSQSPFWKGGQLKMDGYVFLLNPEHPRSMKNGYVKRARLVLEEKLGRHLLDGCIPHHRNGIKTDDRPGNLIELLDGAHKSFHGKLKYA